MQQRARLIRQNPTDHINGVIYVVVQLLMRVHIHHRFRHARLVIRRAIHHTRQPRMKHRARTHQTRLQGHIQLTLGQTVVLQRHACCTQGLHLGMRRWIVQRNRLIKPRGNDLIVVHHHRTHGHFACIVGLLRTLQGMTHEEIEAVIGHEIAHVANGDMVTMTLIQGVMNTFVVFLSRVIGYAVDSFLRKGDSQNSGPGIGYMVTTIVLDIVLGFAAAAVLWLAYGLYFIQRHFGQADPLMLFAQQPALERQPLIIGGIAWCAALLVARLLASVRH